MLDTETKRRIDNCRDILVGKVPDPKSQVEQITIALIYKFMDDMDAEAEELGGGRTFFAGAYARFGWAQLMSPSLGGFEVLALYSEAIQGMRENSGVPELFRDIFKNAYLPYRDPETLKSFLKEINGFSYDHSERLGDAFEYLLSVLGSQGDAGQFRTPRDIIDFIVELVAPKKDETILDPACGTAGFLISAWKYILRTNTAKSLGDKLTPSERTRLTSSIKGYDISPDMVRLSLVNLYLHGFPVPHIEEYDTLTQDDKWNELADVILANPPFMSPKGGIKPHKRFSVPSSRSEVLFVDYIVEHLSTNGRAGIVVPEGIIFQSGSAYTRLREVLVKYSLVGVISLPSGVFQPYSGVKTSILILDKRLAKLRSQVLFSDVQAIGVSLGIKRTVTTRNDLPQVLKDYAAYYAGGEISDHSWLAERKDILGNGCNLSGAKYRTKKGVAENRWARLGDLCHITKGTFSSTKTEPGPYRLIVTAKKALTSAEFQIEGEAVCVPLISSTGHGRASINRVHFAQGKFAVANLLAAVRPKDAGVANVKFLHLVLEHRKSDLASLMKGAANVSMKVEDLAQFEVPLPPVEVQQQMVTEIDGYQKVIDGARQVLDSYKTQVVISPTWPIVALAEIADLKNGLNYDADGEGPTIKMFGVGHFKDELIANLSDLPEIRVNGAVEDSYLLKAGDILFVRSNGNPALVGRSVLIPETSERATFSGFTIRCRLHGEVVPKFFAYLFKSTLHRELFKEAGQGAGIRNLSQGMLKEIKVPLPDPPTQRAIVAEIDAEQSLINANRELIRRMDVKIKAAIDRVWGLGE